MRVIEDPAGLPPLRDAWERLRTDVRAPSSQLDYVLAHMETLPPGDKPHIVTVWDGPRLTGVAPLVRTGRFPKRLRLTDGAASGFLYADEQHLARLVDAVLDLRLPLDLAPLFAGAETEKLLRRRARRGSVVREETWLGGPSLPVDPTWVDPLSKLHTRRRKDFHRGRRRAEEMGDVAIEVSRPGECVEELFDELVRVEARGWKGRAGTALVEDLRQREALRRYITSRWVRGSVQFISMRIGGQTAAIDLNVTVGDRFWGLKGGVDERYKRAAPGLQLKASAIACAAQAGLERFEFMGATAAFKEMWGTGPVELRHLKTYPLSRAGAVAFAVDGAMKIRRSAERRLAERGGVGQALRTAAAALRPERTDATAARAAKRRPGSHVSSVGSRRRDGSARDRSVRIIDDLDGLESLRAGWRKLQAEVPGPSSHLDWIKAYAQDLPPDARLCLVTVYEAGRLTGVAPLVRTRGLVPRLRLVTLDVSGLLYTDRQQLRRLLDAVLGLRLSVAFDSLLAGSPSDEMLRATSRTLVRTSTRLGGPSQPLDASFTDPLAKLTSRHRNDLRRKLRKAERQGTVSFQVEAPGDDFVEQFAEFVRLEGSGWKTEEGTALGSDTQKREQLWRYISAAEVRDRVRIATMRIDDVAVAADLGVIEGNRYWFNKGGYDVANASFSPGILLKVHTIGWAAEQGLERFEFMGEAERYKLAWGADPQQIHHLNVYPPSLPGALALGSDALAKAGRILRRRGRTDESED